MSDEKKQSPIKPNNRLVIEMNHEEARAFFLKPKSYCNLDLPLYIDFSTILSELDGFLSKKPLSECKIKYNSASEVEEVNHPILCNKDGKYAWRPIKLINPALYVDLVHLITQEENWKVLQLKFARLGSLKNISCESMPTESQSEHEDKAEQIKNWIEDVEKASMQLSLDYEYLLETDIADCYGSIYTHSVPWAIYGKKKAKTKKYKDDKKLLGNAIDFSIREMSYGQTNGIPQGSVLMDFIAEIILGYLDWQLAAHLRYKIKNSYKIIRYRDDYRIFTNTPQDAEEILKTLTSCAVELGLKIHSNKTKISRDIITSSLKEDKLYWITQKQDEEDFVKHLLIIHELAKTYPNSGSLPKALDKYLKKLEKKKPEDCDILTLINISTSIAYHNPKTYNVIAAIISNLLEGMEENIRAEVIDKVRAKLKKLPNTGWLEIWLQRATYKFCDKPVYIEKLCKIVNKGKECLWDDSWISSKELKAVIKNNSIIDETKLENMPPAIAHEEISIFPHIS